MSSSAQASAGPTSVRWAVLALLFAVSFAAYVQRLNFNVAGKFVMDDLGISKAQLGWAINAFIACYTIFQLPGGMAGERFGPRRVLAAIVLLWGVFTLLSGLLPGLVFAGASAGLVSLALVRALMGASQAPVFPVLAGSIESWFPVARWALPNALTSSGLTLGAMVTPPLVAWLAISHGWRASLVLTALPTFAVAALWWWYARDEPGQHAGVNRAELALIRAGRAQHLEPDGAHAPRAWLRVLASREILLLTASYFCMNYVFYFFFSWFFIYLVEQRGMTALEGGFAASVPWIAGALGAAAGGAVCDWACRSLGPRWGCRLPCVGALALVTVCLVAGAAVEHVGWALLLLSLAFGLTQFTEGAYWAGTIFVAGRHTATACGILNTGGNLVGVVSTPMFVLLEARFGAVVAVAHGALFALLAAGLWLAIRVDRPLSLEERA